jgi:hypothetical protein
MILLAIGGYAVVLASKLFDMLVYTTVINLGGALASLGILGSDGKYGGLDVVWMAFRDLANILIIGIFVFIAISIILGLEQFGQKKLIARVLIIAILINFSLLFSKIIVDVSNLVAFQFYKGMVGVDENGNIPQTSFSPTATQVGIAGAFMGKLGIQTALDGGKIFEFKDTAGNTQSAQNLVTGAGGLTDPKGRILAFIYSIVVTGFLLFLSYILAKASYLLASRAILLILLMMTSSLAFASYLIPQFSEHKFGWSGWWNSLLRSAFFGPLLVMFLWASLTVLKGVKAGSIGSAVIQPTNPESLATFFKIILTTGLLYASIRVANSFSDDVPGLAGSLQGYSNSFFKYGVQNPSQYLRSKYAYLAQQRNYKKAEDMLRGAGGNVAGFTPQQKARYDSLIKNIGTLNPAAQGKFESKLAAGIAKPFKSVQSIFTEGAGKGGYAAKMAEKQKKSEAKDAEEKKIQEVIGKNVSKGTEKEVEAIHKENAPSENVIKEIVSATITGALKKKENASVLSAHKTEHDNAEQALQLSRAISDHDRETDVTQKQAKAAAIMSSTGSASIDAARKKAIDDVASTTKLLADKLGKTREGLAVLGGAVKKSTQQIQEHHTASTVRAYAEKKHGGNMVKAFTEVTKHLKSKSADASNKDVIQALGKLGTK